MWLHSARTSHIASQIVNTLTAAKDIETESKQEVQMDVEAVLNQYVRDERELNEKARELLSARGLPSSELGRMRKFVAEQRQLKLGDDALDYLLDQLIEMFMHSANVDEIYAEDIVMRRKIRTFLRAEMEAEEQLETEVRGQLGHVKEGTSVWEVEYQRMMHDIKRRKGL